MKFGLKEKDIETACNIFKAFNKINAVLIFGSRVLNSYKEGSDVDLALKGDIDLDILAKVKYILEEETNIPYFFDIIDYKSINNQALKEHIDKYGELFYTK